MTNTDYIAQKLISLRKKAGLSQEDLADKLYVSRQAVSKWERGETLPDTDNLISIAKLFNVSLDELVGNDNVNQEKETSSQNGKNAENGGVHVNIDNGENKVKVDLSGIHVETTDGDDKVIVDLCGTGINVNLYDGDDDDDDDDGDVYYSYTPSPSDKKRRTLRFLHNLPYPIIVTIAFLIWGFLGEAWHVAWTLYVTIPVYYSLIDCFRLKKVSKFLYPVFIAFVYCLIGMQWGFWHPYWILFLTIPVFYPIAHAIERK